MATSEGPLARLRAALQPNGRASVAILLRVGNHAVGKARQAFEDQGRGGVAWPPRVVPNLAGVIEDAKTGSTIKARRFESRPAGIDTSTLRNSIAFTVEDGRRVLVGSTVPYASKVQRGGEDTITISDQQRQNLKKMLSRRSANARVLQFSKKLRRIANGTLTSYKLKTPPRPFLMVTDQDRADYNAIVVDEVRKELAR